MTKLLYLADTYIFEGTAKILSIESIEGKTVIILDQTIFYPQGGGQPSDTGSIANESGEMRIEKVRLNEQGEVLHFGEMIIGNFEVDQEVTLRVDEDKRKLHARLHTAGHFIDICMQRVAPTLHATKGYHFPDGPYVEYEGDIASVETQNLASLLQEEINKQLATDIHVSAHELNEDEMKAKNISAPVGKKARMVSIGDLHECGCGGTHVRNTNEIGKIIIRKISGKEGRIRISYEIL